MDKFEFSGKRFWAKGAADRLGRSFRVRDSTGRQIPFFFRELSSQDQKSLWDFISSAASVRRLQDAGEIVPGKLVVLESSSDSERMLAVATPEQPGTFAPNQLTNASLLKMAIQWLRINRSLFEDGLGLTDAHFGNWMLPSPTSPIWVDHGSISPLMSGIEGLRDFREWLLRPLLLSVLYPHRSYILRGKPIPLLALFPIPFVSPRFLNRFPDSIFLGLIALLSKGLGRRLRGLVLDFYLAVLVALQFIPARKSTWSRYRKGNALSEGDVERRARVSEEVYRVSGSSILDLGGNDGWMLEAVEQEFDELILVDPDEAALTSFVKGPIPIKRRTRGQNTSVVWAKFDEFCGSADVVLAMAITHHLILGQGLSISYVVQRIRDSTKVTALIEFMPLGNIRPGGERDLPDWYSTEVFEAELREKFSSVERLGYSDRSAHAHRILFVCTA